MLSPRVSWAAGAASGPAGLELPHSHVSGGSHRPGGIRGVAGLPPLKDQRGFARSLAGRVRTVSLGSPRPPAAAGGGPNQQDPAGGTQRTPPPAALGHGRPSPAPVPGRGLKGFRGALLCCGWTRRRESSGSSTSSVRGGRPAGGRQRRAPASRAQGYGGRWTGSYQLLAFPRGEKVRARLGGEGGERDKNRVRRFVPCTARRHPRPSAEAAAGEAPPAPREGSGAMRDTGAASAEAKAAVGAAAARAGAAAGWTPRLGTPGLGGSREHAGPGPHKGWSRCPEKAWEQDAAGVWGQCGPAPTLITSLQLQLFCSPGGGCEQNLGQDGPPRSRPTPGRSPGLLGGGGKHRLWAGEAKPRCRSLEGHELSPA